MVYLVADGTLRIPVFVAGKNRNPAEAGLLFHRLAPVPSAAAEGPPSFARNQFTIRSITGG